MRDAEEGEEIIDLVDVVEEPPQSSALPESYCKEVKVPDEDIGRSEGTVGLEEELGLGLEFEEIRQLDTKIIEKIVREVAQEVIESVAIKIAPDITKELVKAMGERTEIIAQEFFPQIAEKIIKKEIEKLKEAED